MADSFSGGVIGELGDIGKKIGGEVAKVPADIAGKALESMGASSGKKAGSAAAATQTGEGKGPKTAWEQLDTEKDVKVKKQIARRALEELTQGKLKQKEPSIWERLQMENDQKKEAAAKQQATSAAQAVPMPSSKRPRGDLYGAKAKQTATENRNVRQD